MRVFAKYCFRCILAFRRVFSEHLNQKNYIKLVVGFRMGIYEDEQNPHEDQLSTNQILIQPIQPSY